MYKETQIICPNCNKESGYTLEGLMHMVIMNDLTCPHCNSVVVRCPPTFTISNNTNNEKLCCGNCTGKCKD